MDGIRFATIEDTDSILTIYAQYIDTPITFEYTLPSQEEFQRRILEITSEYPYLVYEMDGHIVGYAYAHRAFSRAAYQWNTELSVYLDKAFQRQGIGKKLYIALMKILKLQGVQSVIGCVTHPNEASERLHTELGFSLQGTYRQAGYKCGKWWDVNWYEKSILGHDMEPEPIMSITRVEKVLLNQILDIYSKEKS